MSNPFCDGRVLVITQTSPRALALLIWQGFVIYKHQHVQMAGYAHSDHVPKGRFNPMGQQKNRCAQRFWWPAAQSYNARPIRAGRTRTLLRRNHCASA
jgi:hypothetical protein